jgi:predicted O-linked N-acetylglucosamine transferase (SPINDLY family)
VDEAVSCYQRAVQAKPDFPEAHTNLGNVSGEAGELDAAAACYRRALELKPDYAQAHSNLLLTGQYRAGVTLAELAAAHAAYDRQHAAPLRTARTPHTNDRDPLRRLRLGFVSPDFGRHPVGYFLIRTLENLDPDQCETVCYCDRRMKDGLALRLQAAAMVWRDVQGLSDKGLAETIRADRIDILFDLAGHTALNRLLAFARKPAPVQITWLGYVGTTGLAAMDDLIADRFHVPPRAEVHFREKVLRMPDGYVCFEPPDEAPAVGPLPALERGQVTFGSFNNVAKLNSEVIALWAEIVRGVPGSRLVLVSPAFAGQTARRRVGEAFVAAGGAPEQLELRGRLPRPELLAAYNAIDVALDPFPYSGGVTTCEALWMGVPVVTCPVETFASRHSLSHLSNVGLTETIATTRQEYAELAVSLAGDLPRLARLRAGLRPRMAASPLCDGQRFAANLMQVLRDVWRAWCQ